MSKIKDELKEIVEETMIPEVEKYLEELIKLLENKEANEDDIAAIKEMESFMVELQNIIEAINTNQMNDTQASKVYEKIMTLINEHQEH